MYPSTDQESYYIPAIYTFSQRSIQSYYQEDANNTLAGFGLEHINEDYGLNFWGTLLGNSERNGRSNCYTQIAKSGTVKWSDYVNLTEPAVVPAGKNEKWNELTVDEAAYPIPMLQYKATGSHYLYLNSSSNYKYPSGAGCLNRNRDLNGDGKITIDEIRWYVPSSQEYLQITIGQTELPSPLIQFMEHDRKEFKLRTWDPWPEDNQAHADTRTQLQYHYWCSDNRYFFADEGMSIGNGQFNMNYWAAQTVCYQVRCMRALGKNPQDAPAEVLNTKTDPDEFGFNSSFIKEEENGHIYITSKYFTNTSIRPSTSTFVPPHDISSTNSMPPHKFEVAKDVCRDLTSSDNLYDVNSDGYLRIHNNTSTTYTGQTGEINWNKSCTRNTLCSQYTQEANGVDKGTWRVPSIRELAMMQTVGLADATDEDIAANNSNCKYGYYLSCTYEYFENPNWNSGFVYRFYGKRGDDNALARNLMTDAQNDMQKRIHVKCVRDVTDEKSDEVDTGNE
jgi:hypothetical protein